ncbi:MAG: class I SAM-dependent methyltransferase [Thermoplasmatota archaeon]
MPTKALETPWRSVSFKPLPIPGMLSGEEKRYLFWLASQAWQDRGHIVEMGPWLGGSTSCIAEGMLARPTPPVHRLHTFDVFVWRTFMDGRIPDSPRDGESFLPLFERNVARYGALVAAHVMALPDNRVEGDAEGDRWLGGPKEAEEVPLRWTLREPVEILFVDGAKTWDALRYLLSEFRPWLAPGSLLVFQDYKHWAHYWVAAQAEALRDSMELVHVLPRNSVAFRLTSALGEKDLDRIPPFAEADAPTILDALESAARRLEDHGDGPGAWIVRLGAVRALAHAGRWDEAVARFRRLDSGWPLRMPDGQLEAVRSWLTGERGASPRRGPKSALRRFVQREAKKPG